MNPFGHKKQEHEFTWLAHLVPIKMELDENTLLKFYQEFLIVNEVYQLFLKTDKKLLVLEESLRLHFDHSAWTQYENILDLWIKTKKECIGLISQWIKDNKLE